MENGAPTDAESMIGKVFLYHTAAVEKIPVILQEGLVSAGSSYRDRIESDVETFAEERDIEYPISRQNCAFFHLSLSTAVKYGTFRKGAASESPSLIFGEPESVLVIDAAQIQQDLFVADFSLFSDIIDLAFGASPDESIKADSYDEALEYYAKSVRPINSFNCLEQIEKNYSFPEVLVEGRVPPESITECLFLKTILGTGWFTSYPPLPP